MTLKISVIVTSFNHSRYITQCLDSILQQKGVFTLDIILGDDCSVDNTRQIMSKYVAKYSDKFILLPQTANVGVTRNIQRCINACSGEYIAFCEGDDYWTDSYKLAKQTEFLQNHPDYAVCFNAVMLEYEDENKVIPHYDQVSLTKDTLTIEDLIACNYIGNFSCCMYRASSVRQMPDAIYDMYTVDWMFNMACSRIGKIGFLRDWMSVYRIHSKGAWSGKSQMQQCQIACQSIDNYDKYFGYKYHALFEKRKKDYQVNITNELNPQSSNWKKKLNADLLCNNNNESFFKKYGRLLIQAIKNPGKAFERLCTTFSVAFTEMTTGLVSYHDAQITELTKEIQNRDMRIEELTAIKEEYGKCVIDLKHELLDEETQTTELTNAVREREEHIVELTDALREREEQTTELTNAVREREEQVEKLTDAMMEQSTQVTALTIHVSVLNRLVTDNKVDLLILDTIFPHPSSRFRLEEFCAYLSYFKNAVVLSTGEHLGIFGETAGIDTIISQFERIYPAFAGRTKQTTHAIDGYVAKLAYLIFLNNVGYFLDALEKKAIPFIFTLYPGGGFKLNDERSDCLLRRVFHSPQFRKVIVTQPTTRDYLLSNKFCSKDSILYLFCGVAPAYLLKQGNNYRKRYFGFDKDTLDICFVAIKYMPLGIDKGYDVFIEVAKALSKSSGRINFHVVGNFNEDDIPLDGISSKVTFYGLQKLNWFDDFYIDKDIILSPNMPFVLAAGAFDGFPTLGCVEAGLRKVAVFCTDELKINQHFVNNEEIVIIPHNVNQIVRIIQFYYKRPEKLRSIAEAGAKKMQEVFSYKKQMIPRIKLLKSQL